MLFVKNKRDTGGFYQIDDLELADKDRLVLERRIAANPKMQDDLTLLRGFSEALFLEQETVKERTNSSDEFVEKVMEKCISSSLFTSKPVTGDRSVGWLIELADLFQPRSWLIGAVTSACLVFGVLLFSASEELSSRNDFLALSQVEDGLLYSVLSSSDQFDLDTSSNILLGDESLGEF